MTSVDELIAELALAPDLAEVLRRVTSRRDVGLDRQNAYISLRPAGHYIAAYFNKRHVDVVVEPLQAQAVCAAHPGTSLLPKRTSETAYVRIPSGTVEESKVVTLIEHAIVYRESGARWSGQSGPGLGADLAGATCVTCHFELAKNGSCGCD